MLRLPPHGSTVTAGDLRTRLLEAAEQEDAIEIDASDVESVGQAVLQLLVAARADALAAGQTFTILNPSHAFLDRVTSCQLAAAIGIETGDAE
ncbi:STAS domain-containing protein [Sphingomonas sp. CJ20]